MLNLNFFLILSLSITVTLQSFPVNKQNTLCVFFFFGLTSVLNVFHFLIKNLQSQRLQYFEGCFVDSLVNFSWQSASSLSFAGTFLCFSELYCHRHLVSEKSDIVDVSPLMIWLMLKVNASSGNRYI